MYIKKADEIQEDEENAIENQSNSSSTRELRPLKRSVEIEV